MGGKYKLVLAAQYFFCKLHPDFVGLFRSCLPRVKRLYQMAAQMCTFIYGVAAGPGKFNIGGFGSTPEGRYQKFPVCFGGIANIVNRFF